MLVLLIALPVLGLGCGPKGPARVSVTGRVTYRNMPLTAGTVAFISQSSNVVATGTITNGQYTVAQAPVGAVKITVVTPQPQPQMQFQQKVEGKTMTESAGAAAIQVPATYSNPEESKLAYTVTGDKEQTHDLDLQ
jgi:hypothetical protein